MVHPHRPSSLKRPGLTLMELVVVMFILIALAAILVPLFPSMIERAHRSTGATNTSELTKAVQLYQAVNGSYPDGYDLMTDGTTMVNYMPSQPVASPMILAGDSPSTVTNYLGFQYPVGGYVSAAPLTQNQLTALNGAGITTGYALLKDATTATTTYSGGLGWTPTFNPYPGDSVTLGKTPLAVGTAVIAVNGSGVLASGLGNPAIITGSPTQFVLLGVGRRCTMVGNALASAPSNFPNDAVHENPAQVYMRLGLVFQLEDANKNPLPAAVCLGAVAIESNLLLSTDQENQAWYQNTPQVSGPNGGSNGLAGQ